MPSPSHQPDTCNKKTKNNRTDSKPGGILARAPILVTGGSGFIGHHLVQQLAMAGLEVRILDQHPFPRNGAAWEARVTDHIGSILDRRQIANALNGIGVLFHIAGYSDLWAPDHRKFEQVNLRGTEIIIEEALSCSELQRVIYTSSAVVFHDRHQSWHEQRMVNKHVDESHILKAENMCGPYCLSKYQAEKAMLNAATQGLPVIVVNPTLPIGSIGSTLPTPPMRMILEFIKGCHPAYLNFLLNLIDVRDCAEGHWRAAQYGRIGERYLLGGHNLWMKGMLSQLAEQTGLTMPKRQIPYKVALIAAYISEFIANHITHRPPTASLTGVRLAAGACAFNTRKAQTELGFVCRDLNETFNIIMADLS